MELAKNKETTPKKKERKKEKGKKQIRLCGTTFRAKLRVWRNFFSAGLAESSENTILNAVYQ